MIKIPEWLAVLPKSRMVSSKDFATALGVTQNTIQCRLAKGLCDLPRPDFRYRRPCGGSPLNQWKAVTVRNYIRKLNRESGK